MMIDARAEFLYELCCRAAPRVDGIGRRGPTPSNE